MGLHVEGLVDAFQRVLSRIRDKEEVLETNHYKRRDIRRDEHTVQGCMLTLLNGLRRQGSLRFEEAFSEDPTKEEVVTLFLAML